MTTLLRPSPLRSTLARLALAALCGAAAANATAQTAEVPEASPAERLVFMTPHLANVAPPRTLDYSFVQEGGTEPRLADRMTLQLKAGAGGACCVVNGSFLSGPRTMRLPEITDARSNPAVLYYLENEVRELQRLTKGQAAHFRQRIRLALVNRATVTPTTVTWGGKEMAAQAVRIAPFADDPYRSRFERLAPKEYTFVLADGVPGGLYQILGALPGTQERDTLTLEEPAAAPSAKR
jgi:hypothetical protein